MRMALLAWRDWIVIGCVAASLVLAIPLERISRRLPESTPEPSKRTVSPEDIAACEAAFEREWARRMCLGSDGLCSKDASLSKEEAREDFFRRSFDPDA